MWLFKTSAVDETVKSFFRRPETCRNISMTFSRNLPSVTMTSNSLYESGRRGLLTPHLYRPASDFISCVMLTYNRDFVAYLRLNLPFWASKPIVWTRTSSPSHSPLQKNFLPTSTNWMAHPTLILPPSVPWMYLGVSVSPSHSAPEKIKSEYLYFVSSFRIYVSFTYCKTDCRSMRGNSSLSREAGMILSQHFTTFHWL